MLPGFNNFLEEVEMFKGISCGWNLVFLVILLQRT